MVAQDRGDDELLTRRALFGAADAYDELYRRHRDRVARVAFLLLGDPDQAQDVAQEAFLLGWRDLRRLRDARMFRPWVTGIAVNLCRRRRRAVALELNHRADLTPPADPTEVAEAAALRIEVRRAVEALPRHMREAIVLRFYGGFAEAEIAAALTIPLGTVKSRLGRARARLAVSLRAITEVDE
jgi:RNA polymerase sigma-70 factor (ECF subfamily)